MHRLVDPEFDRAVIVKLLEDVDIFVTSAGVLDLRPTKFDITFHAEYDGAFRLFPGDARNATSDQALCSIKQHPVWLATLLVFRYLAAKRIRSVLIDAGQFQGGTICYRAM